MSARAFAPAVRALTTRSASRSFQTSSRRLNEAMAAPVLPARRPVGAFRGGLFGFLLGASLAGAGTYSYVVQEYKVANDLLTEDIYALQAATQRMSTYLTALEEKIDAMERKKK